MHSISIVIVNYGQPTLTHNCIETVVKNTNEIEYEIILVNNDKDDSCKDIIKHFPEVKYIHTATNMGFGRANNVGISHAKNNIIVLLNSDCLLTEPVFDKLVPRFYETNYMACGVQLLNADGSYQHGGRHFSPKNMGVLLKWPYVQNIHQALNGIATHKASDGKEPVLVDWINGAFLMFKKHLVEPIGFFDEEFFLYSEETEWCYRMGKCGGLLAVFPDIYVYHLQGVSTKEAFDTNNNSVTNVFDSLGLQMLVSEFLRTKKQFGTGWLGIQYLVSLMYVPFCWIIWMCNGLFTLGKPLYSFTQMLQYTRCVLLLGKWVLKMYSAKKQFYKVL
jgi:GT2 family glycosyltransferase